MKRYSRSQSSRYDQIKRSKAEYKILPIFEPSGILEAESNNNKGEPLKHILPADAISPDQYWDSIKLPISERPIIKAILYKKGVKEPLSEFNLDLKSHYIIGRQLRKEQRNTSNDSNENESDSEIPEVILSDIGIPDPGCSKEHCVIQFREKNGKLLPYIMDLNSSNGTTLNGILIPRARYVELRNEDLILFSEFDLDSEYELLFMFVS
ncbi:similar to Saccharomyces cerevisiae YLR016C PML1 Subunit of the RES complex, which is required for nuclear retention of unspliced pre-mRNAs [Maudiozyma saulgeensis]|uniref:Similar to Saccharomyces cerevisiae YLR016C PML1 Subunit of the RES complex, which is required for nuclear retention of unspliced pre-mRNAs n=1 Tax=Maudiozyma saulgeensis TaxID=1789683 RepID=A0A1X7QZH1_9SACH|nr:similar to Saccharomyces cerevisiae YLR016C PML1 Subunit of the RES complex, which is required for nuclear retention of unspliced pre-mRNAs [Kazachstania saulgeensis]